MKARLKVMRGIYLGHLLFLAVCISIGNQRAQPQDAIGAMVLFGMLEFILSSLMLCYERHHYRVRGLARNGTPILSTKLTVINQPQLHSPGTYEVHYVFVVGHQDYGGDGRVYLAAAEQFARGKRPATILYDEGNPNNNVLYEDLKRSYEIVA